MASPSQDEISDTERGLEMTQYMIDTTAKHLHGLRTQCITTEQISQREIRETESKLIRLIGKQLVAKAKLKTDKIPIRLQKYPDTEQWLKIVDINQLAIDGLLERGFTVEGLMEMTEDEVERLLNRYHCLEEDIKRLVVALNNLRMWTDIMLHGDGKQDLELHWSSYKSASSSPYGGSSPKFGHHQRPSTSSLPPDLNATSPQSPASPPTPPQSTPASPLPCPSPGGMRRRLTPPPTPSLVKPQRGKFPTTPPPQKKNKLYPECRDPFHPLIKSKSHESQLSNKINQDIDIVKILKKFQGGQANHLSPSGSHEAIYPRKCSTDGTEFYMGSGHTSPLVASPKHLRGKNFDTDTLELHPNKKNQLLPPMSPNSPSLLGSASMKHSISHRLVSSFRITACDWCQKQMLLGVRCKDCKFQSKLIMGACDLCHKHVFRGKSCRYCKMRFHRDCANKAAPACGLPTEYVDYYIKSIHNGSPSIARRGVEHTVSFPGGDGTLQSFPDSSSNTSSCTSSTASSPAPCLDAHPSPSIQVTQFQFPDVRSPESTISSMHSTIDYIGTYSTIPDSQRSNSIDFVSTNTSNDSDKSDKTLIDTGSSSEKGPLLDRVDSQESTEDGLSQSWHRVNSISVALKEWDIPYEELQFGELLGKGRFGKVYRGLWHGDVAIKMLNMDPETDNQAQLQAFKLEVSMLRKTRHENLVLFMGACMKPPHLAIVTSLCKNHTLYTHIHMRNEKFQLNRAVIIASQVIQGMGYLHAKDIVHKDLKTKNIFLEPGKVVITDFGLFNVTKLCHGRRRGGEWLSIPPGWLCYLAPEIIQNLRPGSQSQMDLPFSKTSDIYAFGTVWYELLVGEWPYKNQPPEVIIWQVGKGMKQSLGSLHQSKDIKDVLMSCWSYNRERRPDFSSLLKTLEKIPKKRGLERCPSHPIQLSRSAESVF